MGLVLFLGCYESHESTLDAEADGRAEGDVVHDDEGGTDADAAVCPGAWRDPMTGYLWENPPSDALRNWDDAITYCNSLTLCSYPTASWHLPDIDELRSLIRGCPATETGGACGVTDACLDWTCWADPCLGCSWFGGPAAGGCYWDAAVGGPCDWYWSSSSNTASTSNAWSMVFFRGYLGSPPKATTLYVRCVRPGP